MSFFLLLICCCCFFVCLFYFFCFGTNLVYFVAVINPRGLRGHTHHGGETWKEAGMAALVNGHDPSALEVEAADIDSRSASLARDHVLGQPERHET